MKNVLIGYMRFKFLKVLLSFELKNSGLICQLVNSVSGDSFLHIAHYNFIMEKIVIDG
jgi:hypothetical protein